MHGMTPVIGAVLLFAFVACAPVGPDYERPQVDMPEEFASEFERGLSKDPAELAEWWKTLNDTTLNGLITQALEANLDLASALMRVRESRALRGVVTPDLWPTVDVGGDYTRNLQSTQVPGGGFLARDSDIFNLGFQAGWELDLWGRVRRNIEASDADIEASVEDTRAVLVAVIAETAATYVMLREAQARMKIAQENIAVQQRTLSLTRDRFEAGLVGELDVAQAESILEATRATLPPLATGERAAKNRIAVLIGAHPGSLEHELDQETAIPAPPSKAAVGVPANLLRRRPDVRRSERQLAAQTARIGIATADLYPRFSLNGTFGVQSEDAADVFTRGAVNFGLGPSVTWNVFDRSRLRSGIEVEDARQSQALLAYEQTILLALEEVENAMTGFVRDQASRDALARAVDRARRALELSRDQYREGLVGFQSVLDSQARLFELEDALARTQSSIIQNLISLYRALGGGWESRDIIFAPRSVEEES